MSSKLKRLSLGAVVLSTSVAIGVLTLSGATASASATTHTINFIAVNTSQSTPTASGAYYESYVGVASGATISDGVLSCTANATTETCDVAGANAKGIIDGHFTVTIATGALTGTVTGGTGAYANATGTLTGAPVEAGEGVTVKYTT
jgi:hypothetical protein